MHAISNLPSSHVQPKLVVLAHKVDFVKAPAGAGDSHSVTRVRTVLERELEKRRTAQTSGHAVEKLGNLEEEEDVMGGLECRGTSFSFEQWEGGECVLVSTSVSSGLESLLDEVAAQ